MSVEEKLQRKFYNAYEVRCARCDAHLGYRADSEYGGVDIFCDSCAEEIASDDAIQDHYPVRGK